MICYRCREGFAGQPRYIVAGASFHIGCYPVPREVLDAAVAKEIAARSSTTRVVVEYDENAGIPWSG